MPRSWWVFGSLVVLPWGVQAAALQYEYDVTELPYVPLSSDHLHYVSALGVDDQGRALVNVEVLSPDRFTNGELCQGGKCERVRPRQKSVSWSAFNQASQFAGTLLGSGTNWPIRRDSDGTIHKLARGGGTNGINSAGVVVGYHAAQAFYFDTEMHLLPGLGGKGASAVHINDNGLIVGYATKTDRQIRAVSHWNGVVTDLGVLDGGTTSFAHGVNSQGDIVGCSNDRLNWSPVPVKFEAGAVIPLGTLGGTEGCAGYINDLGVITGWSETVDGESHAFVLRDGAMIDLNVAIPADEQAKWYIYSAGTVNHAGQVMANAFRRADMAHVALLLTPKPAFN